MKGEKFYKFIDPKTKEVRLVSEDNLGGFEGDFMSAVRKRFGKHVLILPGDEKENNKVIDKFFSDCSNFKDENTKD